MLFGRPGGLFAAIFCRCWAQPAKGFPRRSLAQVYENGELNPVNRAYLRQGLQWKSSVAFLCDGDWNGKPARASKTITSLSVSISEKNNLIGIVFCAIA